MGAQLLAAGKLINGAKSESYVKEIVEKYEGVESANLIWKAN